jgi:hypothetical protein
MSPIHVRSGAAPVDSKTVKGLQRIENPDRGKKVIWTYVGAVVPSDTIPNPVDIHLCEMPTLSNGAKALNAEVQVEVGGRIFLGKCDDDPDTFCGLDENGKKIICEEFDESIVLPVDENGDPLSCDPR